MLWERGRGIESLCYLCYLLFNSPPPFPKHRVLGYFYAIRGRLTLFRFEPVQTKKEAFTAGSECIYEKAHIGSLPTQLLARRHTGRFPPVLVIENWNFS